MVTENSLHRLNLGNDISYGDKKGNDAKGNIKVDFSYTNTVFVFRKSKK